MIPRRWRERPRRVHGQDGASVEEMTKAGVMPDCGRATRPRFEITWSGGKIRYTRSPGKEGHRRYALLRPKDRAWSVSGSLGSMRVPDHLRRVRGLSSPEAMCARPLTAALRGGGRLCRPDRCGARVYSLESVGRCGSLQDRSPPDHIAGVSIIVGGCPARNGHPGALGGPESRCADQWGAGSRPARAPH